MLEWNEIRGFDKRLNHRINVENGVNLPDLNEEVLFYRTDYRDATRDICFLGYVEDDDDGVVRMINLCDGGENSIFDGLKWSRFNKPWTKNNTGYAIAYLNEYGHNFTGDIPFIVRVKQDNVENMVNEFQKMNYSKITVFNYMKPCTFQYDWDYIMKNEVAKEEYSFSDEERRTLIIDEFAREDHDHWGDRTPYNYGLSLIKKHGYKEVADDEAVQYYCKQNNLL